ncbi:MAG: hypothetical protein LAT61_04630 [Alcanivorax sp.]|nr:hypothetical protein [Alcanivorax sp.]
MMNNFRKLALVSAIAAMPMTGFAMQAMDDEALSGVTGQDGISIGLELNATLNVGIEDTDGFATATDPGLLLLIGHSLSGGVTIDLDSGTRGGNGVLRVGISVDDLVMETGNIHVMPGTDGTGGLANMTTQVGLADSSNQILDSMTISIDELELAIELGAGATDFLNIVDGNVGTLGIANFQLNDLAGGGAIGVDNIEITGLDLSGTTASLNDDGLELTMGSALDSINISMSRVSLNAAATTPNYLGNVYITGLDIAGTTVTISGK